MLHRREDPTQLTLQLIPTSDIPDIVAGAVGTSQETRTQTQAAFAGAGGGETDRKSSNMKNATSEIGEVDNEETSSCGPKSSIENETELMQFPPPPLV